MDYCRTTAGVYDHLKHWLYSLQHYFANQGNFNHASMHVAHRIHVYKHQSLTSDIEYLSAKILADFTLVCIQKYTKQCWDATELGWLYSLYWLMSGTISTVELLASQYCKSWEILLFVGHCNDAKLCCRATKLDCPIELCRITTLFVTF